MLTVTARKLLRVMWHIVIGHIWHITCYCLVVVTFNSTQKVNRVAKILQLESICKENWKEKLARREQKIIMETKEFT